MRWQSRCMPRPDTVVLFTGTGTDVGKTWVAAEVARRLCAATSGVTVAARKPAQSFAEGDTTTDADVLAGATGEAPHDVCPPSRWYPVALAPPMAADALGRPRIAIADLAVEVGSSWPASPRPAASVGLVEAAGGLCSPIAHDGDALALVELLEPDLTVVVTEPSLGVISNTRLAVRALGAREVVVYLNWFDTRNDLHRRNLEWLTSVDGMRVAVDPGELAKIITEGGPTASA